MLGNVQRKEEEEIDLPPFHELPSSSSQEQSMPLQQQQQPTPGRENADCDWATFCGVLLAILLLIGVAVFIAWLNLHPRQPRFAVSSLTIFSGGQVAFNVSASNPNRHFGIIYEGADTRASILFDDEIVASGPVFSDAMDWYQPRMNTTCIAGVIDVVKLEPSFSADLRAGRLRLRLRLRLVMTIRFALLDALPAGEQFIHVNCDLIVGADGSLLRESVAAPCNSHFSALMSGDGDN